MNSIRTYYVTPITIPLILLWAPILGLISMVYSRMSNLDILMNSVNQLEILVLSMRAFLRQRRNFKTILDANQGSLQTGRFIRLMALAGADVLFSVPLSTFFLWSNTHNGLNPWISWADTHYNFSYVRTNSAVSSVCFLIKSSDRICTFELHQAGPERLGNSLSGTLVHAICRHFVLHFLRVLG